jgi:hypothetical protein
MPGRTRGHQDFEIRLFAVRVDADRQRVDDLDILEVVVPTAPAGEEFRVFVVEDAIEGELDVVSVQSRAVMHLDAFAQLHLPDSRLDLLPLGREAGLE